MGPDTLPFLTPLSAGDVLSRTQGPKPRLLHLLLALPLAQRASAINPVPPTEILAFKFSFFSGSDQYVVNSSTQQIYNI